jgi:hypothetical protein
MNSIGKRFFFGLAMAVGLVAAACSRGDGATQVVATQPVATAIGSEQVLALNGILATKDLSIGTNRISFLLTSPKALVTVPTATVASVYLGSTEAAQETAQETATAEFFLWPFGSRGSYVTELSFDKLGDWRLDVDVQEEDGSTSSAQIPLRVEETSVTPGLGTKPPTAVNKTSRDVAELTMLTTRSTPDPDLYQLTIAEALETKRPFLVVFASPALCTSPTCGPQVETVEELKNQYKGRVNFIHVEVYENPAEIQGDLSRAQFAPIIDTWGFTKLEDYRNESFSFIIGSDGKIASKYEGYASIQELEKGLEAVVVGAYLAFTMIQGDDVPIFGGSSVQECVDKASLTADGQPRVGPESTLVQDTVQMVVRDSSGKVKAEGCIE